MKPRYEALRVTALEMSGPSQFTAGDGELHEDRVRPLVIRVLGDAGQGTSVLPVHPDPPEGAERAFACIAKIRFQ